MVRDDLPVRAALCFIRIELGFFARPFSIDGVVVTWPRPLARALVAAGPLGRDERSALTARLARAFPSYGAPAASSAHAEVPEARK